MAFYVDDPITLTFRFRNKDGVLTNPTSIEAGAKRPDDGTVDPIVPANVSTGVYEVTYTPDVEGDYWIAVDGDGAVDAYAQTMITIEPRRVPLPA